MFPGPDFERPRGFRASKEQRQRVAIANRVTSYRAETLPPANEPAGSKVLAAGGFSQRLKSRRSRIKAAKEDPGEKEKGGGASSRKRVEEEGKSRDLRCYKGTTTSLSSSIMPCSYGYFYSTQYFPSSILILQLSNASTIGDWPQPAHCSTLPLRAS